MAPGARVAARLYSARVAIHRTTPATASVMPAVALGAEGRAADRGQAQHEEHSGYCIDNKRI